MNNVLIDCERTKYPNTGLYHFCMNLGNALLEQADPSKEEIFLYLLKKQQGLFGKNIHYVTQHKWHKFFQPFTKQFDVWHCTYQGSSYRPFNKKTKVVLTIHDLNFLIERKKEPGKIKKYTLQAQQNIDRADHIVCISDFTRRMVLDNMKVNSKPVEVIYNGCNINEFPGFDKPVYKPLRPFIFSIGTVLPKKNFHVLPCLLKNNDYELVISGIINKEYEQKIFKEARMQGVEHRIKLTGPVPEESKYWYYKNCLAFAFPSLAEGFGFPLVEAMYYGKPVFASTLTSLPEIGGDLAWYFDSFEPAAMQHSFEQGMQQYSSTNPSEAIHKRAMEFNWANAARYYLSVYRSLYSK
jgi:glycosyltransferase involved in cell wall biosynthesis